MVTYLERRVAMALNSVGNAWPLDLIHWSHLNGCSLGEIRKQSIPFRLDLYFQHEGSVCPIIVVFLSICLFDQIWCCNRKTKTEEKPHLSAGWPMCVEEGDGGGLGPGHLSWQTQHRCAGAAFPGGSTSRRLCRAHPWLSNWAQAALADNTFEVTCGLRHSALLTGHISCCYCQTACNSHRMYFINRFSDFHIEWDTLFNALPAKKLRKVHFSLWRVLSRCVLEKHMGADGAGGGSNESRLSEHSRTKRPP